MTSLSDRHNARSGNMQEAPRLQDQTVATIICGGNLTLAQMREWLRD